MIFCCVSQQYAQKTEKRIHSRFNIVGQEIKTLDEHVYTYLFYSVVNFDTEAEKSEDYDKKVFLSTYFQNESGITDEQYQNLKTISYNFVSAYPMTPKKEKSQLTNAYENLLKGVLGEEDFTRFKSYLDSRLAPSLKVIKYANFTNIGSSSISYNASNNTLSSVSGIVLSDGFLPPVPPVPCSTSATMTGPNVSVTGSDSADCNVRLAQVTLTSTSAIPGSRYCTTANHTFGSQTQTTTACLDTPAVQNVTSVTFEQIETDDLPISVNPNEGGGFRIFADDKVPNDPMNRRKIRVKAKYGQTVAGIDVYFQSYDMDDISSNDPIIDPNGENGFDNKDEIDPVGRFSIPSGASGCELYAGEPELIRCQTNSLGEVSADFTVTRQPGDNFSIAASTHPLELGQITVSGLALFKVNNEAVPLFCPNTTVCRTDVLTVWRRLHIEVDSMGVATENNVSGTFSQTKKVGINTVEILVAPDSTLKPLRFTGGRLVAGRKKFKVTSNGGDTVFLKSQLGATYQITEGERFVIYDDDDYNNSNGLDVTGDSDENITNPSYMLEGLSPTSDMPNDNILAPACIKPVYDALDTRDDNTFHLNLPPSTPTNTQTDNVRSFFDKWDSSTTNTDRKFWSVYLLGAYQPDTNEDGDNSSNITLGIVDAITSNVSNIEGSGALLFLEVHRVKEFQNFTINKTNPNSLQVTVAHEVGHLFGCIHGDSEIMGNNIIGKPLSNKFSLLSLNRIRGIKHP